MLKSKEIRAKMAKMHEEMRAIRDKAEKEERDSLNEEEGKKWDELSDSFKTLEKEAERQEEFEARERKEAFEKAESVKETVKKEDKEKRSSDSKVEVTGNNLKSKEARNAKVFRMLQGFITRDSEIEIEARKSLVEGGHFDDIFKEKEERNFSTLKDGKGGILVPTSLAQEIFDIQQQYGFIPQFTNSFGNIGKGDVIVPNVLSRPTFSAVNEGSAISGSGLNLGGIRLRARKWGTIIDWTNEIDEEAGARLIPIINEKIAEALAFAKDDTFFNGTGTSAYNGIKGLETLVGTENYVRQATAASGNVSFATLDAEDFLLPQENVTPGKRAGCRYVMHPNMLFTLRKLKDGQGMFIYGLPSEVNPVGTLWGFPISVSEAFPITDGTSNTVCAFVNPMSIAYADGRTLTVTRLDQATVTNEDSTSVNLATTDAQALRWTTLFDIKLDNNTRTTAGTAQGAFSVLRTAAT